MFERFRRFFYDSTFDYIHLFFAKGNKIFKSQWKNQNITRHLFGNGKLENELKLERNQ